MNNINIMYKNRINKIFLEFFLGDNVNEEEIFNILYQLGITQKELFFYNFQNHLCNCIIFYRFFLDAGGERLIFNGDLTRETDKITVIKENSISNYSYKDKKIELIDVTLNTERVKPEVIFDRRKSRKALRDFFFCNPGFKSELIELVKNLDIKPGFSVYVHNLDNNKFRFGSSGDFSLTCNCNDTKNSKLILTCEGSPYLNKETIKIVSDDRSDIYDYYHHKREKVYKRER